MGPIRIEEVEELTDEVIIALARLTPQLSSSGAAPGPAALEEIISSPATVLLIARDDDDLIVGSLTLAMFQIPTGLRSWIEDVVVDQEARGRGVGDALNRHAIALARAAGARTVDLTSRPSREAANRLYRRLGFVERDTNVYRYELG